MSEKDLECNLSAFEAIIRIIMTINLVGVIVCLGWTYLIVLPFMLLVTSLTSFCPVRWLFRRLAGKR